MLLIKGRNRTDRYHVMTHTPDSPGPGGRLTSACGWWEHDSTVGSGTSLVTLPGNPGILGWVGGAVKDPGTVGRRRNGRGGLSLSAGYGPFEDRCTRAI